MITEWEDLDLAKKKKVTGIARDLMPPLVLAGGAIGASVMGGALQSKIPAGMVNPLTTTGSTLGRFVGPVAAISAGGIVMKQLKKTKRKLR